MLTTFDLTIQMKAELGKLVEHGGSHFSFSDNPLLASLVSSLGIVQEVGTLNDELHRHIIDKGTGQAPALSSMKGDIVSWKGRFGVRVFSTECHNLELNHPQLLHLIHPEFSWNEAGELKQLVIFPQAISDIIKLQGVELVIVKDWAMNTVFGGFDGDKNFYVTNDWEIRQNDGLRMARLISKRQLAFLGTHDLVAHIAGTNGKDWDQLQTLVEPLIPMLSSGNPGAISHLIVPYIVGVLLDDLAQPAHYRSTQRIDTILQLSKLQAWVVSNIPAMKSFRRFPASFSKLIDLTRQGGFGLEKVKQEIQKMGLEVQIFGEQKVS